MIDSFPRPLFINCYLNNAHKNPPSLNTLYLKIPYLSHGAINLIIIAIIIKYFAGNDNCGIFIYACLDYERPIKGLINRHLLFATPA